jgi:predicted phage-related endonuclease
MTLTYGRAVAVPFLQGTPEWERERLRYIGSSSIPILTGNAPASHGSPVLLWALMAGVLEPEPVDPVTQELFDLGHEMEHVVARRYTLKTGTPLKRVRRMLVSRDIPFAAASLDRIVATRGARIIVECKWSPYQDFAGEGDDLVPPHVVDQVQWQMLVLGWEMSHVAVIIGARFHWFEVPADHEHQDNLLVIARDFMGYVERKERPPVDGSDATMRALARMHPRDLLELRDPDDLSDAYADELREADMVHDWAKARLALVKNQVREVIGDHEGVEREDRYRITWKADKNGQRALRPRFYDEGRNRWY